jgi:hypothetical protein
MEFDPRLDEDEVLSAGRVYACPMPPGAAALNPAEGLLAQRIP